MNIQRDLEIKIDSIKARVANKDIASLREDLENLKKEKAA